MNEAQQQKEKEKLEYLSHLIATISPDPVKSKHCTRCNGKGWRTIDVAVTQGEIHYKVEICCGVVGTSPYAKLTNALKQHEIITATLFKDIFSELTEIQRDQFLWRKFWSFFKIKILPIFKGKGKQNAQTII
jgi:hypothetical protein